MSNLQSQLASSLGGFIQSNTDRASILARESNVLNDPESDRQVRGQIFDTISNIPKNIQEGQARQQKIRADENALTPKRDKEKDLKQVTQISGMIEAAYKTEGQEGANKLLQSFQKSGFADTINPILDFYATTGASLKLGEDDIVFENDAEGNRILVNKTKAIGDNAVVSLPGVISDKELGAIRDREEQILDFNLDVKKEKIKNEVESTKEQKEFKINSMNDFLDFVKKDPVYKESASKLARTGPILNMINENLAITPAMLSIQIPRLFGEVGNLTLEEQKKGKLMSFEAQIKQLEQKYLGKNQLTPEDQAALRDIVELFADGFRESNNNQLVEAARQKGTANNLPVKDYLRVVNASFKFKNFEDVQQNVERYGIEEGDELSVNDNFVKNYNFSDVAELKEKANDLGIRDGDRVFVDGRVLLFTSKKKSPEAQSDPIKKEPEPTKRKGLGTQYPLPSQSTLSKLMGIRKV